MPPADGEQPGAGADVVVKDAPPSATDIIAEKPWFDGFKDADLKGWAEKNGLKDAESTAKQLRDAQKLIGSSANKLDLPKDGEDFTQWAGHDKLGIPKEAKAYEIAKPQLPEGMTWDESFEGQVKEAAAKLRLHPSQLNGLVDVYTQARVAEFNELQKHTNDERAATQNLLKEWGADKDANIEFAKRGGKFLGLSGEEMDAIEKGLIGGPALMKALLKFGKAAREGSSVDGDASPIIGKEALKAELNRLNERIGKGETLTAEEMKKRSALYSQIHG